MKVYVSNYLSNSISILDPEVLEVESEILFEDAIHPHSFYIDNQRNIMYIPSSITGDLYLWSFEENKIIDTLSIGGNINGLMIHNSEMYLVNEDSNSIYIIDIKTLKPEGIISVDEMPRGLDIDKINNKLYVPCSETIVKIDTKTKQIEKVKEIKLKAWSLKLNNDTSEIYVATIEGKILVLDRESLDIKNIIDKCILPIEMVISNIHNRVYISDIGCKGIIVLDYKTNDVLDTIDVGGYPQGLCLINDDKYILVSDTQNNIIKIYSTEESKLIKSIKVGKEPTTIACL